MGGIFSRVMGGKQTPYQVGRELGARAHSSAIASQYPSGKVDPDSHQRYREGAGERQHRHGDEVKRQRRSSCVLEDERPSQRYLVGNCEPQSGKHREAWGSSSEKREYALTSGPASGSGLSQLAVTSPGDQTLRVFSFDMELRSKIGSRPRKRSPERRPAAQPASGQWRQRLPGTEAAGVAMSPARPARMEAEAPLC